MTVRGDVAPGGIAPGGPGPGEAVPAVPGPPPSRDGRSAPFRPGGGARTAPSATEGSSPRRPRRAARVAATLAAFAVLTVLAGLVGFVLRVADPPAPAPFASAGPAPGIAVLTGGPDRVERGLALLAEREDSRLLISGVGHSVVPSDLGAVGGRIALGRTATSTRGNALEVAAWARETGIRDITVVTAGFHMPRALLELRRALPEGDFRPHPVAPHLPRSATLLREYAKLLGGALGLSALLDRPRAPDKAQPDAAQPDSTRPDSTRPGATRPGATASEPRS